MEGDPFEARIVRCSGMAVVECAGSIEQSDGDRLWAKLYDAILVSPHVMVDLSEVTFLDPAGLSELLHASRVLTRIGGGRLAIRGAHGPVARLLDVTDTRREFRIDP